METEITRRSVLLEALEYFRNQLRGCSVNGRSLIPLTGYDEQFTALQEKTRIIREMIRALESEPVRRSLANWQTEVMAGNRQVGLFKPEAGADYEYVPPEEAGDGYPEEDGADYPEGERVSGRDDFMVDGPEVEHQPVGCMGDADPGGGKEHPGQDGRDDHAV